MLGCLFLNHCVEFGFLTSTWIKAKQLRCITARMQQQLLITLTRTKVLVQKMAIASVPR